MALEPKDPTDRRDYLWNWAPQLGAGETLTTSTWTITPAGLTKDTDTLDTTSTTIWLTGGKVGVTYHLTNHVTTSQGREFDLSGDIDCKEL